MPSGQHSEDHSDAGTDDTDGRPDIFPMQVSRAEDAADVAELAAAERAVARRAGTPEDVEGVAEAGTCRRFLKTDPLAVSGSLTPPDAWRVLNVEDWAEIRRLHRAEGVPIKEIARRLGVARNTVRAALASDRPPTYERAPRGSVVDAFEPQIRALLAEWPRMPAPVIARADRLAVLDDAAEEAGGADPAGVRGDRPGRPGRATSPGELAQCDLWFPRAADPGRAPGRQRVLPVLVMTLAFSRFLTAVMIPSRQAGDILSGMWELIIAGRAGAQDAGVGPGVRDRRDRAGQRAGGGVRRHAGHADPAGPAAGPGVQGDGRARQRLLRDLVPARPHVRLAGRLQRPDRRLAGRGPTPAPSASIQGRPVDLLETDRRRWSPLPPVAPPVGLTHRIRLGRDYYVRVDTNDYSVDPRVIGRFVDVDRLPDTVDGALRRAARRRPRPVLGQARAWSPTRPTSPPPTQMRHALAEQRRAQQRPGSAAPPPQRRARRRAARPAGLRRPVRRRLQPDPHPTDPTAADGGGSEQPMTATTTATAHDQHGTGRRAAVDAGLPDPGAEDPHDRRVLGRPRRPGPRRELVARGVPGRACCNARSPTASPPAP